VAVVLLFIVWFPPQQNSPLPGGPKLPSFAGASLPVAQYYVDLNGRGEEFWLNFFRLFQPDMHKDKLLALIWKRSAHFS